MDLLTIANNIYSTFKDGIDYLVNRPKLAYAVDGNYSPVNVKSGFLEELAKLPCYSTGSFARDSHKHKSNRTVDVTIGGTQKHIQIDFDKKPDGITMLKWIMKLAECNKKKARALIKNNQ